MKKLTQLLTAVIVASTALTGSAFAQYPAEFTKNQADSTIMFRRAEIGDLQMKLSTAQADNTASTATMQQTMASTTNCQDALYSMLGSDRNGFNQFRENLTRQESELAALRGLGASQLNENVARVSTLENNIRQLRGNMLVLIPDHFTRVRTLSSNYMNMKHGMQPANAMYTVGTWRKDRDCLWNIAKKPEIYNDPFAWPKIWHANMDIVRNPDLIHPGQQLEIVKTAVTEDDRSLTGYRKHHSN